MNNKNFNKNFLIITSVLFLSIYSVGVQDISAQVDKKSLMGDLAGLENSFLGAAIQPSNIKKYSDEFKKINEKLADFISESFSSAEFQTIRTNIIDPIDEVADLIVKDNELQNYKLREFLELLENNIKKIKNARELAKKPTAILPKSKDAQELLMRFASVADNFLKQLKSSISLTKVGDINQKVADVNQLKENVSLALGNLLGEFNFLKNQDISPKAVQEWKNLLDKVTLSLSLTPDNLKSMPENIRALGLTLVNKAAELYAQRNNTNINLRLLRDKFVDDIKTQINIYKDKLDAIKSIDDAYAKDILNFVLKSYEMGFNKVRNNIEQYLELRKRRDGDSGINLIRK